MKSNTAKVSAFILIAIAIAACNSVKRVPDGKLLLTENKIFENNKVIKTEITSNQLSQNPNAKLFGFPLALTLYNWAKPNPDSTYLLKFKNNPKKLERMTKWLSAKQVEQLGNSFFYKGIHNVLKKIGDAPEIIDKTRADKSLLRLKYYYFNQGFFDIKANYTIDSLKSKKGRVNYFITTGKPYVLDSITPFITSPAIDSLYRLTAESSIIKSGIQYKTEDFENEKNRLTSYFRNNGAYHFQPNNITFNVDTINKNHKANINLKISDFSFQENDSSKTAPFKLMKISEVKIYTDYKAAEANYSITDSTNYNNFTLLSKQKLKYRPKAITNAIFIYKGSLFSDNNTSLTSRYISNLKIFNYPSIIYENDKRDSTSQSLIAKIYLTPKKKYSFGQSIDITHSNIQNLGIGFSPSISIRNVFNGAETLEFSGRANVGSSQDFANPNDVFFNASELGLDLKLNFPRIVFPFKTERIIPKNMFPSTLISTGYSIQKNIGLDKENLIGAIAYNWTPKKNNTARFDLFNVQFVRNLNPTNYFNVYTSSYDALNEIAKKPEYNVNPSYFDQEQNLIVENGTNSFIQNVLSATPSINTTPTDFSAIKSIEERRIRLIENDFILATSFSFSKTTKKDISDNNFYLFKTKIESAGSLLSLFANASNMDKSSNGRFELFDLEYSEYIKTEFDYIKHWGFSKETVFALRSFFGIAIPFGNSNNIPFSRSYYSGGSNDNRAWNPFRLGPGSTGGVNDFNEANMKLAVSAEFRFQLVGNLKGALFVDAGNIWNVLDNTEDRKAQFTGLKDLENIAIGSGFGMRYDFGLFVFRLDLGFKTYNPANEMNRRWLKDFGIGRSVLNFGINYPF
ncbi:BamA/TamA family outer membrane protein [Flavobacterium ammonificans]|uniref:translocation and assembly module lipoprotein TamL n=1 Tax=Flavobacterium ammonificans TaxID=1751056 RepID=UPI001E403190|nr:BamA/TamA family outer membrane protein [Flavobacterium ammonificans]BDB56592.1 membrane protein [Flavobacterium ammonificans]